MKRTLYIRLSSLALAFSLVVVPMLLVGCGDDDDVPRSLTHFKYDIVTYMGVSPSAMPHFLLINRDDEGAMDLFAPGFTVDTRLQQGDRMMLRYDTPNPSEPTLIAAYGITPLLTDSVRYTEQPLAHYLQDTRPVKMLAMWRTGDYINVHCQLEYTGRSRHFYLLMDSTTRANDTIDCYLVHKVWRDTTYQWRDAYASFYAGVLLATPSCRTIGVHVEQDDSRAKHVFYFTKTK